MLPKTGAIMNIERNYIPLCLCTLIEYSLVTFYKNIINYIT